MRRFLRSNVGRPWNKVHQELCEHVCFDNPVQSHVLTHVFDYVQQHVEVRGHEVFSLDRWRRGRPLAPGQMYICPTSGLLKVVRRKAAPAISTRVGLGGMEQIHLRDGAWWKLHLRPLTDQGFIVRRHAARRPVSTPRILWDVWLERWVSHSDEAELVAVYGGKFAAISKRPLSPGETRDLYCRLRTKKRFR
jgi:hypothetical protein